MFNHTAIQTCNPQQSRQFYRQLGLTEIAELSFDTLTVWLMGDPSSAEKDLTHRQGLLEIVYPHPDGQAKPNTNEQSGRDSSGLVKLCFTVPDLAATLKTILSGNVELVKSPGGSEGRALFAARLGIHYSPDVTENKTLWDMIEGIALVLDPDGYLIELIQQVPAA